MIYHKRTLSRVIQLFIFVLFVIMPLDVLAATIWCNPGNAGAEDGLSKATGYKTLWSAMAALSSNDTLIIADGDWTTYADMTIDTAHSYPSGTGGNYTKIQAETEWEVRIPYVNVQVGRSYVEIRGIVFDSRLNPMSNVVYEHNHTKFIRCGFLMGKITGNNHNVGFGSSDPTRASNQYNLMEECIAWGGGRYVFYNKYGKYNIFRRCIARHDNQEGTGAQDDGMISNFRAYASDYAIYQNCISIDTDRVANYNGGNLNNEASGFWLGDQYGATGNEIQGSISIKDVHMPFYIAGAVGTGTSIINNSVGLDPVAGYNTLNAFVLKSNTSVVATNVLGMGALSPGQDGFYGKNSGTLTVTNSIVKDVADFGVLGATTTYVNNYNAGTGTFGTGSTTYDPETNGLLYPVRIESGSVLETSGSGGGTVGPTILKKIGVSETLYGEDGWDTVTGQDLWPFPNETKIKTLMRDTVSGVDGKYGFCADGNGIYGGPITLTSYIWEYLGNACPADICDYPPSPPKNLSIVTE